jgi:hypothetical protein
VVASCELELKMCNGSTTCVLGCGKDEAVRHDARGRQKRRVSKSVIEYAYR